MQCCASTVVFICVSMTCCFVNSHATAAEQSVKQKPWLTGKNLQRQLNLPLGVNWQRAPLAESLERLSVSQNVAIFLDRRVDPGQLISCECVDQPLRLCVETLAKQNGLQAVVAGNLIYVGPPDAIDLATLVEMRNQRARPLPTGLSSKWLKRHRGAWSTVSEPRQIVRQLLETAQISFDPGGLNKIPHDLWAGRKLPQQTILESLTIVLFGFGLSADVNAKGGFELTKRPKNVTISKSYRWTKDTQELHRLRERFPAVQFNLRGKRLGVAARVEQHLAISEFLAGRQTSVVESVPQDKRYTLRVKNQPIGPLLRTLSAKVKRKLVVSPAIAAEEMQLMVTFDVKDQTLTQLFQAALGDRQWVVEVTDDEIRISPAL